GKYLAASTYNTYRGKRRVLFFPFTQTNDRKERDKNGTILLDSGGFGGGLDGGLLNCNDGDDSNGGGGVPSSGSFGGGRGGAGGGGEISDGDSR
ncbi:hypothetical protein A2U01_0076935, partial [Trifolium medium]|nr:hypothetical protein [Trifolium medium]